MEESEVRLRDFIDAGIMRVGVPQRYGGVPVEYDVMFEAGMELGRACGASAWCYSLWVVHSWLVGHFPAEAQEEYFSTGPDTLCSSSFAGKGKPAKPVDGGYRVSGHWEFSSGCDAATWAELGVELPDGSLAWVLVPRRDYTIVDNWYMLGMRGTVSRTLLLKDVFVDCDGDTILIKAEPVGPTCHTGERACFFRRVTSEGQADPAKTDEAFGGILERLARTIQDRKRASKEDSYVASLLQAGPDKLLKKVVEEAGEVLLASKGAKRDEIIHEVADLVFHTLVVLGHHDISLQEVYQELAGRFGKSGLQRDQHKRTS